MMLARLVVLALSLAAIVAPARADEADPSAALATFAVRGQLLAIDARFVIFATGDALRLRAGTPVPKGATLGRAIVVTIDRRESDVVAIALERAPVAGAIDVAEIPRAYVVASPKSTRSLAARVPVAIAGTGDASVRTAVTLEVTVPSDTPQNDDVYVSTDRSNYSPSEIRMQRVDARRFVATVARDANGRLAYRYTRGNYATVERDRRGGIVEPRVVDRSVEKTDDVVTRWADAN